MLSQVCVYVWGGERLRPHAKLTGGGAVYVGGVCWAVGVGGLNKTKPTTDCGPPLRILKLDSLQRGCCCVSGRKRGRECIFHTRPGVHRP